jgi:hypothetical protein
MTDDTIGIATDIGQSSPTATPATRPNLSETMRTRASAVAKHREEHPENGAPEVSPQVKTAMQEAAAKIRALMHR